MDTKNLARNKFQKTEINHFKLNQKKLKYNTKNIFLFTFLAQYLSKQNQGRKFSNSHHFFETIILKLTIGLVTKPSYLLILFKLI